MREIVLDTETTGLDPVDGHRIVEIGAIELINQLPTGKTYHQYINPGRPMPKEAFDIHGISDEFLRDKPAFAAISAAFLDFIADSVLVIHNAAFDMKFLNSELVRAGKPTLPYSRALDTVVMARKKFPGASASLDALCRRFGVDNSGRENHGALLDSELLAEVYLELIGGRQSGLALNATTEGPVTTVASQDGWRPRPRSVPLPSRLGDTEVATHQAFVATMGATAVWLKRTK